MFEQLTAFIEKIKEDHLSDSQIDQSVRQQLHSLGWYPNHGDRLPFTSTYRFSFRSSKYENCYCVFQDTRVIFRVDRDSVIIDYEEARNRNNLEILLLRLSDLTLALQ